MTSTADDEGELVSDRALQLFHEHERRRAQVAARRQRYWLLRQAQESGTMAGIIVDLMEHGRDVVVRTTVGREVRGRLAGLGSDHLVVHALDGYRHLVALGATTCIETCTGGRPRTGDREVVPSPTLGDALRLLAAGRDRVSLVLADGSELSGLLHSMGRDVATLVGDDRDRYVPTASLCLVVVLPGAA